MRLCLATASPIPSGVGEHMLTLARDLAGRHEVTVAGLAGTGLVERARTQGLTAREIVADEALTGFDLVHVHAGIGWEGHELARAGRAAGVGAIVRTDHLPYLLDDPGQVAKNVEGLKLIDALICVSASSALSHRQAGADPARLHVIANGVAPPPLGRGRAVTRRLLGIDDRAPVLLMVARFTGQKRHDLMLSALGRLSGVELLLAGDGLLMDRVARRIAADELGGRVRMLGVRTDVGDLMAAADLLVLPSDFEGLPLVMLEAMAAGLPAVATRVAGTADVVEHGVTGWLVPPRDAGALAHMIAAALADRDALAAAGRAARLRHRQRFSAARMVADTECLYAAVAQRGREWSGWGLSARAASHIATSACWSR